MNPLSSGLDKERHISLLCGALNFRDLGGLPTRDGHRIAPGRLLRSDTLQALTAADTTFLSDDLGLEAVIDLREPREAAEEGRGPLVDNVSVCYINVPMGMAGRAHGATGRVQEALFLGYLEPDSSLPRAVELLATLAGRPTIFHCAAGAHRTGVLAAVALRLAGVADDVILADYMASGANIDRVIARLREWPRYRDHIASVPASAYAVEEEPLRAFLAALDGRFGGTREWALSKGIRPETLDRLKRNILVP